MPDLALIGQALDFIENNLREPIGVANIADAVGYSLYHFCRVFNKATHHTPYNYLMRRRLAEAVRALQQTDHKIIEIALDYQFNAPETFSRAFKRVYGMLPSRFRESDHLDRHRLMPRLTLAHIRQIHKGPYLRPVLEERKALQVAGVMTLIREDAMVVSDLWDLLRQELGRHEDTIQPGDYYGISWYPEGWERRGSLYMAATEIQGLDIADTALVVRTVPPLRCARFIHKGPIKDLSLTLDYIFHTWLPRSQHWLSHPLIVELYGQDLEGVDQEEFELKVYIPVDQVPGRPRPPKPS